jgi:hypothetical protein
MALESIPIFLQRPPGVDALPIAGSIARPQEAIQVGLQTVDGGVLVKSVMRQSDGSFTGEVYGVTPRQRTVAAGDIVRFVESQIFTFKTGENAPITPADAETAEMIRTFADRFGRADRPDAERPAADPPTPDDFSMDTASLPARDQPEPMPAADAIDVASSPLPAHPKPVEPELDIADAYSMLGGVVQDHRDVALDHDQADTSAPHDRPLREEQPAVADALLPETPPMASSEPVACLECGATLPPIAADETGVAPTKVSCPDCGRINDVAQAEAASRRRRALKANPP